MKECLILQAEGGSISFLEGDKSQLRLAYVNGSHEYVVFDPSSDESHERSAIDYEGLAGHEETAGKTSQIKKETFFLTSLFCNVMNPRKCLIFQEILDTHRCTGSYRIMTRREWRILSRWLHRLYLQRDRGRKYSAVLRLTSRLFPSYVLTSLSP